MMHQPAPPPYSAPQQTPIGWAINNIPNEHSAGNIILASLFSKEFQ
jgi:hypothetical protein